MELRLCLCVGVCACVHACALSDVPAHPIEAVEGLPSRPEDGGTAPAWKMSAPTMVESPARLGSGIHYQGETMIRVSAVDKVPAA